MDAPDQQFTYVYILSEASEGGAADLCATLYRDKLPDLLQKNWTMSEQHDPHFSREVQLRMHDAWITEALQTLRSVLEQPDEALAARDGVMLHNGWGGAMLHVAKLQD